MLQVMPSAASRTTYYALSISHSMPGFRGVAKGGDRRAYMRAWRARNPGYMAHKGREHRERRRLAALALAATNDGDAQ